MKRRTLISNLESYSLLLPNLLLFCAFSIFPVFWTLKYIFYRYGGIVSSPPVFVGLENLKRVFRDALYLQALINTFVYGVGKIVLTLPIAFFLALILNRPGRLNGFFQSVIFVPTIMSSAVMSLVFYLLFNVYNGEINHYLRLLGLVKEPVNWLGRDLAMFTLVLTALWGGVGNYMVYFLAGLQQISRETLESAVIDGANRAQTLWFITIPMLGPILKIIFMLSIVAAFSDMNTVMVLTEGGPLNSTMVMALYGYNFFFPVSAGTFTVAQYGYGAAVSFVSALVAGGVTLAYLRVSKKLDTIF
jgi:ABC-type sugar transport system permease subunit